MSSEISRDRRMLSEILWNKIVRSKQRNDEKRNKKKKIMKLTLNLENSLTTGPKTWYNSKVLIILKYKSA